MKKLTLILLVACHVSLLNAQAPTRFNYQAVLRDASGTIMADQPVAIRISLLQGSTDGFPVYTETHTTATNSLGLVSLVVGNGSATAGLIDTINWATGPIFIQLWVNDVEVGTSQLLSVPYAVYAGSTNKSSELEVSPHSSFSSDSALFLVKDKYGRPVFAVYEDGAIVYVNEGAKGGRGGFAVGGRKPAKGDFFYEDILRVTSDSVTIYINDNALMKGGRGGFAVGGRPSGKAGLHDFLRVTPDSTRVSFNELPENKGGRGGFAVGGRPINKGVVQDFLTVTPDSTRVFFDEQAGSKGGRGGFAVGGRKPAKGSANEYFNISTDSLAQIVNPSKARILWYPKKEAFLTGRVLIENPDSVGMNSFASGFESKSIGNFSQALGYKAIARGIYSTSIGFNSVADDTNSFAFGQEAKALDKESFAFGQEAVAMKKGCYALGRQARAEGICSFAIGSAGKIGEGVPTGITYAKGDYSIAFGNGSQALAVGAVAMGIGNMAMGFGSFATGLYSTAGNNSSMAFGTNVQATGINATAMGGSCIASGDGSTAIGGSVVASGKFSLAMGIFSKARGENSTAIGHNLNAPSAFETVIGSYNTDYTPADTVEWAAADRLFVIGNGPDVSLKSNAMTILKNGNVGLKSIVNPVFGLQLPNEGSNSGSARAVSWTIYSDGRLKENQLPLTYGIKEIMKLSPKQYIHHSTTDKALWSRENAPKTIGLVAQEVYAVLPEVVEVPGNDSTELWGMNYDKLIPVLVHAIQEQQEQINKLQLQNKAQLMKLDEMAELKAEVDELKALLGRVVADK